MSKVYAVLWWLVLFIAAPTAGQSVRIVVMNVRQADGFLIITPHNRLVLIDAGEDKRVADFLTFLKVDTLALAVGTHRHSDHIGGMDNVLNRIPAALYVGDTTGDSLRDVRWLRDTLTARKIPVQPPGADTLVIDGVQFIILPQAPHDSAYENNNSLVVRLEYGQFSMLFAGDAEGPERDWLVKNHSELLDIDVLKASHHGSDNGVDEAWLNATTPTRVVISAGVNHKYQHPHAGAVEQYTRGARVYCTNRHGTIVISTTGNGTYTVAPERMTYKSCAYDGTSHNWLVWDTSRVLPILIGTNLFRNSDGSFEVDGQRQLALGVSQRGLLLWGTVYTPDGQEIGVLLGGGFSGDTDHYRWTKTGSRFSVVTRSTGDTLFLFESGDAPIQITRAMFYTRFGDQIEIDGESIRNITQGTDFTLGYGNIFDTRVIQIPGPHR